MAAPCLARPGVAAVPTPPGSPLDPGVLRVSETRPFRCRGRISGRARAAPPGASFLLDAQACLAYLTKEPSFVPRDLQPREESKGCQMPPLSPCWFLTSSHFQIPPSKTFYLAALAGFVPHTSQLCLKTRINKTKICTSE